MVGLLEARDGEESMTYVAIGLFAGCVLFVAMAWLYGRSQRERGKVEGEVGTVAAVAKAATEAGDVAADVRTLPDGAALAKLRDKFSRR